MTALIMRLLWETRTAYAIGTWIIIILLIAAVLGLYAAILYLIFNPDLKKLQTHPWKISLSVILIALAITSVIHFYRFAPSHEANLPISVPMAIMHFFRTQRMYPGFISGMAKKELKPHPDRIFD